jgi:hypothetical protein
MNRSQLIRIHASAGMTAFALITVFFTASLVAELSRITQWTVLVKTLIFYSMWVMLILMPLAVSTGLKLAGKSQHPIVARKKARLRWLMPNGLILLGLAYWLYQRAITHQFDQLFIGLQVLELVLGAINIILLGQMIRDGFQLRSKAKKSSTTRPLNQNQFS